MNLKKLVAFLILSIFFIPVDFLFAVDLEIEEGKTLLFDFRQPDPFENLWYDKSAIYGNVNIGAGTKVVLDSEWQCVLDSYNQSEIPIPQNREVPVIGSTQTITVQDEIYVTTYTYRFEENIATMTIASTGTITLNAGSELSIRNQYSLVTSSQDVSLEYMKVKVGKDEKILLKTGHFASADNLYKYTAEYDDHTENFYNKMLMGNVGLFTGDIIFESGDSNTSLTFQEVSEKESEEYVLPEAGNDKKFGDTDLGGDKLDRGIIENKSVGMPGNDTNIVEMTNNFQINSNRAVFNVVGFGDAKKGDEWNSTSRQVILGKLGGSTLSGNGMVVKKGEGTLTLDYLKTLAGFIYVDGSNLTGENTGYSWCIEEGMVIAHKQDNLGTAGVYIDSEGTLGLSIYDSDANSFSPVDVIERIENGLQTNLYENKITSSNGEISIAAGTQVELSGDIDTVGENNNLRLTFYMDSALVLSGNNNAENFIVNFGAEEGGEANYLITDVAGLADNSIVATNVTKDDIKEFAYFELVLNEAGDEEYSGSLQGEMYLHKLGTGTVTLSGENTYTQGTYISDGGLLLADTNSIGTGNIWFDRGVKGVSTTYASMGVRASSETIGDITLSNNIHVKNGAILNVAENQNLKLLGDIVSYDARPGYETEFVKIGLGEATISGTLDANRQVNISTFNVQDGGFVLDNNIVLNSYFSLDGQDAYLKMNEDAGIKNNVIDIYSGDLIIFNEKNISSATAVNFYNTFESTESFSKFHIMSDAVLSSQTIDADITIAKNIEFVVGSTTTANTNELDTEEEEEEPVIVTAEMSKFKFGTGTTPVIPVIVKSGDGTFIANGNGDFALDSLYVNDGEFRIENTNMTVSGTTLVDGGILAISQTSNFASTAASAEDKKITVLSGGISIYNDDSIDGGTKLNFDGTDEQNLAKLIVEAANVSLSNDINVKAGINIQNDEALTFSGDQINFDPDYAGILAKSGAGTMTIHTEEQFNMGEVRALEGDLIIESDIKVSTISVLGESALLFFDNVENAEIEESLILSEGGTLSVSVSTLTIGRASLDSATIVNDSSVINVTEDLAINNSQVSLLENNAEINSLGNISFSSSTIELTADSAKLSSGKNINIESSTFSMSGESSNLIAEESISFSSSTIELIADSVNLNSGKDINIESSTFSMLGEGSTLTAEENINFYDSVIDFSADSVEINANNNISFNNSKIDISSESVVINAINNIEFIDSDIILSTNSGLVATNVNFDSSKIVFSTSTAYINATNIDLRNGSAMEAFGNINSNLNVRRNSYIKIGKDDSVDKLKTKNVVFESASSLYIDIVSENGVTSTDKLEVSGDITVQKDVTLYVNVMGTEYNTSKEFEFLTFTGNSSFESTSDSIFNILLSDLKLSANTILRGNSIFLKIGKDWDLYQVPGVTKNQQSMIDVFNKIRNDDFVSEEMKSTINTLNGLYSDYKDKGNKAEFLNALQDLSGIFYANSFMTSAMLSKANIIYNRVNDFSKEREEGNKIWAQVYTNNFTVAENEENPKFENGLYGMIAGYDTVVDENVIFGIAGFYGQGELKQLDDKADLIDAGINAYGHYKVNEKIDVKGLIGYSMQDYDTTRNLRFIKQEIKSKYATNTINVDLEAAYRQDIAENLSLKPLIGANYAIVSNGDIEEDGDYEQKLKIDKDSYSKAEVRIGVGLQTKSLSPFNWYVSAAVKQILLGDQFTTKSYFAKVPKYEFEIESTKLASTSFVGNLGCSYDINSSFNVSLDLNADTGAASGFGANIGATYRW